MENSLYCDFDRATLSPDRIQEGEFRNLFQVGRDRIIHTSAFRRMQGKTQVFFSGDYDFYRTRLTHSIEVAQIGRSITGFLQQRSDLLGDSHFIDPDLVEAACLAHDIGHPPFGHTGEHVLNKLMAEQGGFEGNAQTLRILTETIWSGGTRGMNPPRALLDAVLKYKTLQGELNDPENHFLYNEQAHYLAFVNNNDKAFPLALAPGKERDSFRSVECQIMDWADDTAYSLNDLADSVNAGFITLPKLENWASENSITGDAAIHVNYLLKAIREDRVEPRLGRKVGDFIASTSLVTESNHLSEHSQRYKLRLLIDQTARQEADVYKQISVDLVFRSPQLKQIDFKSEFLLTRLFEAFRDAALAGGRCAALLPQGLAKTLALEEEETGKLRRVCDYLASLTDASAIRTYKRLFDPDFGSIVDLV